jgi:hypothetical protein
MRIPADKKVDSWMLVGGCGVTNLSMLVSRQNRLKYMTPSADLTEMKPGDAQ